MEEGSNKKRVVEEEEEKEGNEHVKQWRACLFSSIEP
jgi:hypothetical protein